MYWKKKNPYTEEEYLDTKINMYIGRKCYGYITRPRYEFLKTINIIDTFGR